MERKRVRGGERERQTVVEGDGGFFSGKGGDSGPCVCDILQNANDCSPHTHTHTLPHTHMNICSKTHTCVNI